MSAEGIALMREVVGAGHCSNPVHLVGRTVNLATGELSDRSLRVPCKDRRAAICPACSYLYKADAWILVSAGLNGGKGLPESVDDHPRLFVTLTAPGFGAVHTRTNSGSCRRTRSRALCPHGRSRSCQAIHELDDPLLGQPLCGGCFDYEAAILWNAHVSRLWNRTIVRLRQRLAATQGLREHEARRQLRLSYLKIAEIQRRGLIHLHVIIRADGPDGPASRPPTWLTSQVLAETIGALVPTVELEVGAGRRICWGTQLDILDITTEPGSGRRIASYLAKYSTKTTDGTSALARRFPSKRAIEEAGIDPHSRRLVLTAWDLHPRHPKLRLRDHAHTLGFAGQLITKSRSYSTTFGQLRADRASHMRERSGTDPIAGSFIYAGRGYTDPRASQVAEMVHEVLVEQRKSSHRAP